jgi:hypothetical protein
MITKCTLHIHQTFPELTELRHRSQVKGAGFSIAEWKGTIEVTSLKGEITLLANKREIVIRQFQKVVYEVLTKQVSIIDTKIKRA